PSLRYRGTAAYSVQAGTVGAVTESEQRRYLGEKASEIYRLRFKVIAPDGSRTYLVAGHGVRGERDDGNVAGPRIGFQFCRRIPAIEHRKAQIHQDDVGMFLPGSADAFGAVSGQDHPILLPFEAPAQHIATHLVVLNDEDLGDGRILGRAESSAQGRRIARRQSSAGRCFIAHVGSFAHSSFSSEGRGTRRRISATRS